MKYINNIYFSTEDNSYNYINSYLHSLNESKKDTLSIIMLLSVLVISSIGLFIYSDIQLMVIVGLFTIILYSGVQSFPLPIFTIAFSGFENDKYIIATLVTVISSIFIYQLSDISVYLVLGFTITVLYILTLPLFEFVSTSPRDNNKHNYTPESWLLVTTIAGVLFGGVIYILSQFVLQISIETQFVWFYLSYLILNKGLKSTIFKQVQAWDIPVNKFLLYIPRIIMISSPFIFIYTIDTMTTEILSGLVLFGLVWNSGYLIYYKLYKYPLHTKSKSDEEVDELIEEKVHTDNNNDKNNIENQENQDNSVENEEIFTEEDLEPDYTNKISNKDNTDDDDDEEVSVSIGGTSGRDESSENNSNRFKPDKYNSSTDEDDNSTELYDGNPYKNIDDQISYNGDNLDEYITNKEIPTEDITEPNNKTLTEQLYRRIEYLNEDIKNNITVGEDGIKLDLIKKVYDLNDSDILQYSEEELIDEITITHNTTNKRIESDYLQLVDIELNNLQNLLEIYVENTDFNDGNNPISEEEFEDIWKGLISTKQCTEKLFELVFTH